MKRKFDYLATGLSPAIQKTLVFESFKHGEVNRSESYRTDASGKCINVCRVLQQGGADAVCLTVAGRENYSEFTALCRRDGLDLTAVETEGRVRICTTLLGRAEKECTEIVAGEPEIIKPDEETLFKKRFMEMLSCCRLKTVIISGSRLSGFSDEIIPFMIKEAKLRRLRVIADYRGQDLKRSFISETIRPDCVKINEDEFFETFGVFESLEDGLVKVSNEFESTFVITRGAESTLGAESGRVFEVESRMLEAVNPIGCGDAMTAGIAQGLTEGRSLRDSVLKGRDYASINAMRLQPGWIL